MATKKNYETNGSTYYRIRRKVEMADGSTRTKAFYGTSKADAEHQYKEFIEEQAELRNKKQEEYDTMTLGARAEEYISTTLSVSQKYAKGTISRYVGAWNNHIKDAPISQMPVKDVRPSTVQSFYASLDVSQQTMKNIDKFMKAFFKWLMLNDYATDVMRAVEVPKKESNTRHDGIVVWEDDEIQSILTALRSPDAHRLFFLVYMLVYTGMRISEVLGLKYDDIRDNRIHVERQWYLKELKEPKYNSKRIIPFHEDLKEPFALHKEWHATEAKKCGYETDFIFTTNNGKLYDRSSVRKQLERFYKANSILYLSVCRPIYGICPCVIEVLF